MKKYMLLCAAAIVAAAACTREPVISEEPDPSLEGPLKVTLKAGSPETRTELATDEEGLLHPIWSANDGIAVITTENDENDAEYSCFDNNSGTNPIAIFIGEVNHFGEYIAVYPKPEEGEEYDWPYIELWNNYDDDSIEGYIEYEVPTEQHPSKTSFDPRADFLVSEPFTISENNIATHNVALVEGISFTRMNAIAKVVIQDETTEGLLQGQTVRKVILGTREIIEDGGGDEPMMMAPRNRADVWDDNDTYGYHGIAGNICYSIGGDPNKDPYYVGNAYSPYVTAIYSDETAYEIGDADAATYLITVPSLLKNEEWTGYDENDNEVLVKEGLYIKVETDNYSIVRHIILPSYGVALQPSCVTTLNVKLYDDGVKETSITEIGIQVNPSSKTLKPGKEMTLEVIFNGINPDTDELEGLEWASSDTDVVTVNPITYEYGGGELRDRGAACTNMAVINALAEGTATITATFNGTLTATCEITVADREEVPSAMVDLGLPSGTKWAQWNLGAISPLEEGDKYAWGETEWKNNYSWNNYKWADGYHCLTKYTTSAVYTPDHQIDNKFLLDLDDDAAYVNWGSSWYTPTQAQWNELRDECTWDAIMDSNDIVIGFTATGPNGNSISFPARDYQGESLDYMVSTLPLPHSGDVSSSLYNYSLEVQAREGWSSELNAYYYYLPGYYYFTERGENITYVRPVSGGNLRKEPYIGAITLEPSGSVLRAQFPVYESDREKEYRENPSYCNYSVTAVILYGTDPDYDPGRYFHSHSAYSDSGTSGNCKYVRFKVEDYADNGVCSVIPEGVHGTVYYRCYYYSTVKEYAAATNSIIVNEYHGVTRSVYIP